MKFHGDILIFFYFIQVFVFTRNHHLNLNIYEAVQNSARIIGRAYTVLLFVPFLREENDDQCKIKTVNEIRTGKHAPSRHMTSWQVRRNDVASMSV